MVQKPQDGHLGPQVVFLKQGPCLRLFLKPKVAHSISMAILYLVEQPKTLKQAKIFLRSMGKCLIFKGIVEFWEKCDFSIAFLGQKGLSERAKYLEFCEEDVETIPKHP